MATFGGASFGGGSNSTAFRYPTFRKTEGGNDEAFDVSKSPLFEQSQEVAKKQLSGEVEGFETQANIARETQKAISAQQAQANRGALMDLGLRDTGTFAQEGIIKPGQQAERDRLDLERRLAVDRQGLVRSQQEAGQAGANSLLGLASEQAGQIRGLRSEEARQVAGFEQESRESGLNRDLTRLMQSDDFSQEEKMANLDSALIDARANNDVGRQQQIMGFQADIDFKQALEEFGYDTALTNLQGTIDETLRNNDHTNAMIMIGKQQEFAADEAVKDRLVDYARIELSKTGLDMEKVEQQYNFIQTEVAAGRADPGAALEFVNNLLGAEGISIEGADPDAIYAELERDFRVQQYQFAQVNPEYAQYDATGKFVGLDDQGAALFNNFLQTSYYGEDGKPVTGGGDPAEVAAITIGEDGFVRDTEGNVRKISELALLLKNSDSPKSLNNGTYQSLLAEAHVLNATASDNHNGISGVPTGNTIVSVNGRLMAIHNPGVLRDKRGRNKDVFSMTDLSTGSSRTWGANDNDNDFMGYSSENINTWASELAEL